MEAEDRNREVMKHLGLVHKIATDYRIRDNFEYMDLVQAGIIGLMRAVELYDVKKSKSGEFQHYAKYWIKSQIQELCNTSRWPIYIPRHAIKKYKKYKKYPDTEFNENDKFIILCVKYALAFNAGTVEFDEEKNEENIFATSSGVHS